MLPTPRERPGQHCMVISLLVTPGILGPDYFHEVAAVLAAAAGGPPDFEAFGAVMRRHGLTCAD